MTDLLPTRIEAERRSGGAARTLIDDLLAEQQELTAVEKFSRAHSAHEVRSRLYRDLLPATSPGPGQQYAFEVDLDKCFGCKACVGACHSLNGLDEHETWRGVGLLVGDPAEDVRARRGAGAFHQHITTACHHCVDPACLNGCPVLAYDKDPATGIVRHLDDQCIGCQYCVMMCPYEVPQYSKARGIVRKCDMCSSRLAVGEAPACAQACPGGAIRITLVEQSKVRGKYRDAKPEGRIPKPERGLNEEARNSDFGFRTSFGIRSCSAGSFGFPNSFLPASPNPAITLPTTRFLTSRVLPENLFAGDHSHVQRAEAHLPLVALLVLSQLAVGMSVAALLIPHSSSLLLVAPLAGGLAICAGSMHLGQPLKAWRAFLGWRRSWFSREVVAMGLYVTFAALAGAAAFIRGGSTSQTLLKLTAVLAGLLTVSCSAMIYADTRREFWGAAECFTKFFGTMLVLGAAAAFTTLTFGGATVVALVSPVVTLALATLAKLGFEQRIFRHLVDEQAIVQSPLNKTARLLAGELRPYAQRRIGCAVVGGVLLPGIALTQAATNPAASVALTVVSLVFCVAGELAERYLFFTAVVAQKMPGGVEA